MALVTVRLVFMQMSPCRCSVLKHEAVAAHSGGQHRTTPAGSEDASEFKPHHDPIVPLGGGTYPSSTPAPLGVHVPHSSAHTACDPFGGAANMFLLQDYDFSKVSAKMQTLTERAFELAPPGGLFDETVIRNFFPESSDGARALLTHRARRAGEVIRLRPGLFVLGPPYRKSEPHPFVVAAFLHSPSHVSLESALSHHGLIPEAVYQVSSVTAARSREFTTPLGVFTFRRVPARAPRAGVEAVAVSPNSWAFVASPLRAIADLVYLNKEITWKNDGLMYLTESLRIEEDDLLELGFDAMDDIVESLRSRRVRAYLQGLKGAVERAA